MIREYVELGYPHEAPQGMGSPAVLASCDTPRGAPHPALPQQPKRPSYQKPLIRKDIWCLNHTWATLVPDLYIRITGGTDGTLGADIQGPC